MKYLSLKSNTPKGLFYLLFFINNNALYAQGWDNMTNARLAALSGSMAAVQEHGAEWVNPAGISQEKNMGISAGWGRRYNLRELQSTGLSVVFPLRKIMAGIAAFSDGDALFSRQVARIAIAHSAGFVRLGAQADIYQVHFDGYGYKIIPGFNLGGIVQVSTHFSFGASVYGITQELLSGSAKEEIPVRLHSGICYKPGKQVSLFFQVDKIAQQPAFYIGGLEYKPKGSLYIRASAKLPTKEWAFGVGIHWKNSCLDFSACEHAELGWGQVFSAFMTIKPKEGKKHP